MLVLFAVLHRPTVEVSAIQRLRGRDDPTFELIGPHVTLVFRFPGDEVHEDRLRSHLTTVAAATTAFAVRLNELELSWDQWLFLTPSDGRAGFAELHDRLYEGLLHGFLRDDIEFVPHVALGHFAKPGTDYELGEPTEVPLDQERYESALADAK